MEKQQLSKASVEVKELYRECKEAANLSYSPYSNFAVGSVIVTQNNEKYKGANIENASYGLCMCAERNAIYSALLDQKKDFTKIAIYVSGENKVHPCGACLQVIEEFMSGDSEVILFNDSEYYGKAKLSEFLPHPFDRTSLPNYNP